VKQLFLRATLPALAAVLALSLLLAGSTPAYAASAVYEIDPNHSAVTFRIRHLMSNVPGAFNKFKGSIVYDAEKPDASSVEASIEAPSIDTNNDKRDEHLRGADFFDAAKFPTIDFKSKSVAAEGGKLKVTGDLTMHGVTKPVTLTGEVLGVAKDPTGKNPARAGFSFTGTINRKDFGIIWNQQLDQSTTLLGDDVVLQLDIEATEKVAQVEAPKPGEPAQATSTK
jgi:polyisoprenoid-binding protein YceI